MRPIDIAEAVLGTYGETTAASVQHQLGKLKKLKRVEHLDHGLYSIRSNSDQIQSPHPDSGGADEVDSSLVRIETVAVEASAGDGSEVGFEIVTEHTYLPRWYVREVIGAADGQEVKRIRIIGNSMEPTLRPGEHVYCVFFQPGQAPMDGSVCFVRGPYGLVVKRIKYGMASHGDGQPSYTVTLWSDNPEYSRDTLPLDIFQRDFFPIGFLGASEKPL